MNHVGMPFEYGKEYILTFTATVLIPDMVAIPGKVHAYRPKS